jgi:hypothetical protein
MICCNTKPIQKSARFRNCIVFQLNCNRDVQSQVFSDSLMAVEHAFIKARYYIKTYSGCRPLIAGFL